MRNNLLSLQQTAKLQDLTQNRLATGLKVNSAIDNPSSYYTAQSLNNRAEDLNVLLDAMSQGIQTLKAVNESIEAGTKFLEQAKSVASSALETAQPVAAKVSNEAELMAALSSGKPGLIVLTADITLNNKNIVLGTGQSLVGARYFDKNAAETSLTFNMSGTTLNGIEADNGSLISDLTINFTTDNKAYAEQSNAVAVLNKSDIRLHNLTINMETTGDTKYASSAAIFNQGANTNTKITGKIKIDIKAVHDRTSSGRGYTHGILNYQGGKLAIDAAVSVKTDGSESHGIYNQFGSDLVIGGNTKYDFISNGEVSMGLYNYTNATTIITDSALINIHTINQDSYGMANYDNSKTQVRGNAHINITTEGQSGYAINGGSLVMGGNSRLNVKTSGFNGDAFREVNSIIQDSSVINIFTTGENGDGINNMGNCQTVFKGNAKVNIKLTGVNTDGLVYGYFDLDENAKVNIEAPSGVCGSTGYSLYLNILSTSAEININSPQAFRSNSLYIQYVSGARINTQSGALVADSPLSTPVLVSPGNTPPGSFTNTGPATFEPLPDIDEEMSKSPSPVSEKVKTSKTQSLQYNQILTQYDMLINDSWYKGVNLLKSQDLKVVFNESRTSDLDIKGVDATSKGLGLQLADWADAGKVQDSLDQIDSAINQLRLYASEFGNYYQIVTTRENFTNSLINVLTEGADALTLADMNQESANMLALQTRQQLAINSLSLASQASQSVLKLF